MEGLGLVCTCAMDSEENTSRKPPIRYRKSRYDLYERERKLIMQKSDIKPQNDDFRTTWIQLRKRVLQDAQDVMIDPIHSLAFSVQTNPGVYALLVGSGVSRTAKIPTGWEITLDLIRKLARLSDEPCNSDPECWYHNKFNQDANYSDLLKEIAKTQSERQSLLREYFEPNKRERENGEKSPTVAHKAIADLVVKGFIKVIITTNFDRLIETAIKEAGVEPLILSTPDQVRGAPPLIHTGCCVFKVNGDYLDIRIKNTPEELAQYSSEFNQLLDRILDDFGLIVCGWSAEWDIGLREAIERTKSRRFSTYWTIRGELEDKAQSLIRHRKGHRILINDADEFFETLKEHVIAIGEFSIQHPISTEIAVQSLKRYLSEPKYRIKLRDLITKEVQGVHVKLSGDAFSASQSIQWTTEAVTKRVRSYETICSVLLAMGMVGGFWVKENQYSMWEQAVKDISQTQVGDRNSYNWLELKRYPATLLFYALGVGAVKAEKFRFLKHLFDVMVFNCWGSSGMEPETLEAVRILPPHRFNHLQNKMQILEGMENDKLPLNQRICKKLESHSQHIIPNIEQYFLAFQKLEILMALNSLNYENYHYSSGLFYDSMENRKIILREIRESLNTFGNESPLVTCNIFGSTANSCREQLASLEQKVEKIRYR